MRYQRLIFCLIALALATRALAGVSAQEAARLGGPELTPVGAERAGNAEGTIPAWTGGITGPIPGYQPGEHHRDPFPDDPILFTISDANQERYADKLSEGQKALLRAYPSWRMNVYRSRRSAAYPEFVYQALKSNAVNARLVPTGRGGVRDSEISSPFPIPGQGVEVVWNHNLRWRGMYVERSNGIAAVTRRGFYRIVILKEEMVFPYGFPYEHSIKTRFPDILAAFKQKLVSPGSRSGFGQLSLEPLDYSDQNRNSWLYSANLRRVFRTPFAGLDTPAPNSDALRTVDQFDMFNGTPYLFNWTLLGKREIYVPYNAYRLHSKELAYSDILGKQHINPELTRYELHRVWVVEGVLDPAVVRRDIPGGRPNHIYSKRVFYLDEDSWQIVLTEDYDHEDQLWRVGEGHVINYYEVPLPWTTLEVWYDLKARRYLVGGLDNRRLMYRFSETGNPKNFSPNALNYYVR
jgi:hypothetical protein